MRQVAISRIGLELDPRTALAVKEWSEQEGRSKRRHLAIVVRQLTQLLKTNPDELRRLGLLSATAGN